LKGLRKTIKASFQTVSIPANVQTRHFANTSYNSNKYTCSAELPDQTRDNTLYLKHDNALLYCVPQNYFMYTLLHTIVANCQVAYHITQF